MTPYLYPLIMSLVGPADKVEPANVPNTEETTAEPHVVAYDDINNLTLQESVKEDLEEDSNDQEEDHDEDESNREEVLDEDESDQEDSDDVIMESLVKKKEKGTILELKRRHLKKVLKLHQYADIILVCSLNGVFVFPSITAYSVNSIRRTAIQQTNTMIAILQKGISETMSRTDNTRDGKFGNTNSPINKIHELKIGDEFLKILRDNAFNGMDGGDAIDHIARVVEITEWIKILDINITGSEFTYSRIPLAMMQKNGGMMKLGEHPLVGMN
ncbi:hypothetical protein Tco_0403285 [Tanacetum coccineum]